MPDRKELAAAIVKGAISSIPIVGGVAAEVGDLYLNPIERRKTQWMAEVEAAIVEIQRRTGIPPENLLQNDGFSSFLFQATVVAMKNHKAEKLEALRNSLVNVTSTVESDEDLAFQFLRFIDELTASHLHLLSVLEANRGRIVEQDNLDAVYRIYVDESSGSLSRHAFRGFLQDLDSRFLIHMGDVEDLPEFQSRLSIMEFEDSGKREMDLTDLGVQFLDFVRSHET